MVALVEDDFGANRRTLCDWVKNFRLKKMQMKRKLRGAGGDLRVCALLSTALLSAEHELRRKQQQRFNRWLEMQSKFDDTLCSDALPNVRETSSASSRKHDENSVESIVGDDENDADEQIRQRRRDEITNLWKCELSGLDEFMKTISSSNHLQQQQQQQHHHYQQQPQAVAS